MDQREFEEKMVSIDRQLANVDRPIGARMIDSWFMLTEEKTLEIQSKDQKLGFYEGPNLFYSIQDWYVQRYPKQSLIGMVWGPRPLMIRGCVFSADIPVWFNPVRPLNAFDYLPDLPPTLLEELDPSERREIQEKYNHFFNQALNLEMLLVDWYDGKDCPLVSQLLIAGRADLKMSCEYNLNRNPGAVLFPAQQAVEKYLKSFLARRDKTLSEKELKDKFGHKISMLWSACTDLQPDFNVFGGRISILAFGQEVRYQSRAITPREAIEIIDFSHEICNHVALKLIK